MVKIQSKHQKTKAISASFLAVLISAVFVMSVPASAMTLYQSCKQMKPFAHRALLGGKDENIERGYEDTRPAIKAAAKRDISVELDVWTSKADGTLVIMHDRTASNTTYIDTTNPDAPPADLKYVTDMTLAQIKALKTNHYNLQVPTMSEAIATAQNYSTISKVRIELKGTGLEWTDTAIDNFITAITDASMEKRVEAFSSNLGLLKKIKDKNSAIVTNWKTHISGKFADSGKLDYMIKAHLNILAIQYNKVTKADMDAMKAAGIKLAGRISNGESNYKAYASKGGGGYYKSIQTDFPQKYTAWCEAQK